MSLDTIALHRLVTYSGISFKQNGVSWIFECPKCNKRDKLYLRKRDGRFVCWYCKSLNGFEGKPEFALRLLLGVPLAIIKEQLYGVDTAGNSEMRLPDLILADFFDEDDDIPGDLMPLKRVEWNIDFKAVGERGTDRALAYLDTRGIDLSLAQRFDLHYHPQERRVIFPIRAEGRLVGWQGRFIDATKGHLEDGTPWQIPKILTSPRDLQRDRVVMFQDELKDSLHAIVCEGPIDAIKCHLAGGAVATMGKSVSAGQIDVIKESGVRRIYLAIDPDAAGEINRLCTEFGREFSIYHMVPPRGFGDFGEMSPEEVLLAFRRARRVNSGNVFVAPLVDPFTVERRQSDA